MNTITFTCEVITPMFLGDATGGSELRPPAIKAALRFWWRAMHADLDLHKMHEKETLIFGGGGDDARRSSFDLSLNKLEVANAKKFKLPHKKMVKRNAYVGGSFKVTFNLFRETIFSDKELISLMYLSSTLGDIGSRARRGMGAWKITNINGYNADEIDIEALLLKIKIFSDDYQIVNNIIKIKRSYNHSFPYIKELHFGNNLISDIDILVKKIMLVAHVYKKKCGYRFNNALGSTEPRLASPIYISILKSKDGYKPIITKLNTRNLSKEETKIQDAFIQNILNIKEKK